MWNLDGHQKKTKANKQKQTKIGHNRNKLPINVMKDYDVTHERRNPRKINQNGLQTTFNLERPNI